MNEKRYMISDAAKRLEVEPHVLRYWEEELKIDIPRNDMGHRCYYEREISRLEVVKQLKKNGFQLKAIKLVLHKLENEEGMDMKEILEKKEEWNKKAEQEEREPKTEIEVITEIEEPEIVEEHENRMERFQMIMSKIISNALLDNNVILGQTIGTQVTDQVAREMDEQFKAKEELEEQRFKKLDEMIRSRQQARLEAAAAVEQLRKPKKKRRFFGK